MINDHICLLNAGDSYQRKTIYELELRELSSTDPITFHAQTKNSLPKYFHQPLYGLNERIDLLNPFTPSSEKKL